MKDDRFKNKYRIASARAQWWDYGWSGAYYVTICTTDWHHPFGEIVDGKIILSHTGVIADILWHEIPHHSPFVELGDFVVMPNHIHGILILNKPDGDIIGGTNGMNVETRHALSLPMPVSTQLPPPGKTRFQNQGSNTISSILGGYKSAVTKHANRLVLKHGWQSGFHDHIIRSDAEYQRISDYIVANPENWDTDKFNLDK